MLKLLKWNRVVARKCAAAFGRLCVETLKLVVTRSTSKAAAFGRLCVETEDLEEVISEILQPPSGGCVLKLHKPHPHNYLKIAAAFGRLCVETTTLCNL